MSRARDAISRENVGLAALTGWALVVRAYFLLSTSHPTGTDGYYYVVQIEDLMRRGALHVPDASWALRWLALPHGAGVSPVLSLALGAAALAAAAVPLGWWAGRKLGGNTAGWALALWAASSPTLTLLAAEFPKNLAAIPASLALLASDGFATGLIAAALLWSAHRTGGALLLVGAAAAGRWRLWGAGAALAALLSAGAAGLLHPSDLARVGIDATSAWPPMRSAIALRPMHPIHVFELVASWGALLAAPWLLRAPDRRPKVAALTAALAVVLLPPWRVDQADLGFRLTLLAPAVAAPLLAATLRGVPGRPRAIAALGLLLPLLSPLGYDRRAGPPWERWAEVIAAIPRPLPPLLITPQGISFQYDHLTEREAMAWAPEPCLPREAIGRLAVGVDPEDWGRWGTGDAVWLPHGWVYLREADWERFADTAPPELLDPRNPTLPRPAWLLRGRVPTIEGIATDCTQESPDRLRRAPAATPPNSPLLETSPARPPAPTPPPTPPCPPQTPKIP